ncbi:CusA/CzcA family heavy metal efflux RND transporter [Rhabdobacter roseus]|jgi:heavy metal efflux system protein
MLDKIIHFSIHNKLVIGLFTLALIAVGIYSLTRLPIDAVPDITNNQVQVITTSPSLAAQEVERLVTFPVETEMATIPDITEIRSISRFGLSVITIVFKESTDIYWARQQVVERLGNAADKIPPGAGTPGLAPVTTGLGEIYQYLLKAKPGYEDKFTAMELRSVQDWIVRRQLLGTPGVADVSSFGGYLKQYEIAIDPDKLRAMDLSMDELFTALEQNNQNTGGAYIDKQPNAYFIRSEGLIGSLDDIRNIRVRETAQGLPVLVRDIATVRFGHAVRYGAMTLNDEGEVVGGLVLMLKGANSSAVIDDVKARVEQIRKSLPEGVAIDPFLDRTKLVDRAIGTVSKNLVEGALIVIFVLVLLLGNLRAGLVVASVIPLAMLFAVSMMKLFGVSGNLMSLGAIDFGLIVDGAVIIVEATLHHIGAKKYDHRLSQAEMDREVYESASKIRNSAAFGEIIILIVYLPILALVGIEGKMFRPMAQTVSFAILGAFILSLTYVPMVSALFLSKKPNHKPNFSDRFIAGAYRLYAPVLGFALRRQVVVIVTALVLFALSLVMFLNMGGEFIPQLDEGDFAIETRVLTGSSLSETADAVQQAAGLLLKEFPDEVVEVVGKIGSSEIPTDPMPVEAADVMVVLKEKSEWTAASGREELADKMQEYLTETIPGVTFGFQQPIQMRFNELMTGVKQDVAVKIYGENLEVLAEQAKKVGRVANQIEGVQDLYVEVVSGLPQIVVEFDRPKLARYGISIEQANRTLSTAFAGSAAGVVYEGERRYDLVVRLDRASRRTIDDVRELFITTADGQQVPLEQVARVEMKPGANQIQRENAQRRITVAFNVRGRDVESIVEEMQAKMDRDVKLPAGYYATYGGQFQNLREASARLSVAVPVALLLIFVLLYFTFQSLRQSILILSAIPLSAIGGVLALWLRGMPFSISAGIGFIALFGVAVLNGIVLIGEFNHLRREGMTDLREVIFRGSETRLRPVLMTALVASLGFLPMALSHGAGAEVQRPLATVVIGGLVTATLLTLLVLPALYLMVEKRFAKKINGKALIVFLVATIGIPWAASAQEPTTRRVTLDEAMSTGMTNNLEVKSGVFRVDYRQALLGTGTEIPKTDLTWTGGQYNSYRFDNSFNLTQTLPHPRVGKTRRRLLDEEVNGARLSVEVTRAALTRDIRNAYYGLRLLDRREELLRLELERAERFVRAADLRYRTGEGNQLEYSVAQSTLADVQALLIRNRAETASLREQLRAITNSPVLLLPDSSGALRRDLAAALADTAGISSNPYLRLARQELLIASRSTDLEKTTLLPQFKVGYLNQSLIGDYRRNGADVFYGAGKRFHSVEAGLAIPIFRGASKARIEAGRISEELARNQLAVAEIQLGTQLRQAVRAYQATEQSLTLYEEQNLPLAGEIRAKATLAYEAGEIGYLEFAQALNRALDIQSRYLDLLDEHNRVVIEIEFLLGQ